MSRRTIKGTKQQIIGRYADWIKTFEVGEYPGNAPLIVKLHEEKKLSLVSEKATGTDLEFGCWFKRMEITGYDVYKF